MRTFQTATASAVLVLAATSLGCADAQKKIEAPPVTITSAPARNVSTPVSPTIAVSQEVADACHLNVDSVEQAPKFAFDESALLPADERVLQRLAVCVTTGPLKGRRLMLVGRADPRGTTEYNMALGDRRARATRDQLQRLGVERRAITTRSVGEEMATGSDEYGWSRDRRSEIAPR